MPHSFPRPAFRRIAFRLCCTPALSLSMLLMTGMPVQAQVSSGAITGKVTDQSGAVVVGASVQVINVRTGVKLNAKTNEVGDYSFRNLLPGTYNLSLSQPGFRTYGAAQMHARAFERRFGLAEPFNWPDGHISPPYRESTLYRGQ